MHSVRCIAFAGSSLVVKAIRSMMDSVNGGCDEVGTATFCHFVVDLRCYVTTWIVLKHLSCFPGSLSICLAVLSHPPMHFFVIKLWVEIFLSWKVKTVVLTFLHSLP